MKCKNHDWWKWRLQSQCGHPGGWLHRAGHDLKAPVCNKRKNGRPISNLLTVKNGDSLNVALLNHLKSYDFVLFVGVFPLQDLSCGFLGLFQALALPPFPMRGIYSAV